MPWRSYRPGTCLEGLRETRKNLSRARWCRSIFTFFQHLLLHVMQMATASLPPCFSCMQQSNKLGNVRTAQKWWRVHSVTVPFSFLYILPTVCSFCFFPICCNTHTFTTRSWKWCLSFRFSDQNSITMHFSALSNDCCTHRSPQPPSVDACISTGRQVARILLMRCFPPTCYSFHLGFKYFPHHTALKHLILFHVLPLTL